MLCSRIPSYMDKSQCLNEENPNEDTANGIEKKPGKTTKITVGHFEQNIDWLDMNRTDLFDNFSLA